MNDEAQLRKRYQTKRRIVRLIKSNELDAANRVQAEHLLSDPGDAEAHHRMATILVLQADPHAALGHLLRAREISPDEPKYASALARIYARLGNRTQAETFKHTAADLQPGRLALFQTQQSEARAAALDQVRSALAAVLPGWARAVSRDLDTSVAERLLAVHSIDNVPLWARYLPQRYATGDIVSLEGIGRFKIGNPDQTLQKRLSRGMPWELAAVALFVEIGRRCDPDALIVDVGANIGTHAVALAGSYSGRVLAFEPVAENHEALIENLALNDIENCIVLKQACGASAGFGRMIGVNANNPGKAKLDTAAQDGIEVTTLDAEVEKIGRPAAFIKIDVEGGEEAVLAGASETLRRDRPVIFCEILSEGRAARVMETLSPLGYDLLKFDRNDCLIYPRP
jgi:FkbM family methyltransferase